MANSSDCKQNLDPLKLPLEGTRQDRRLLAELDPDYVAVDERRIEHALVFAKTYSRYLKYYGPDNQESGNWEPFFNRDLTAQLAVVAVQDIEYYKSNVKAWFDYLNDRRHDTPALEGELKKRLGWLFSSAGTLAQQFEQLRRDLPTESVLKATLSNRIRAQLAPALAKLIAYYEAFPKSDVEFSDAQSDLTLLGARVKRFGSVYDFEFSADWITTGESDWSAFVAAIKPDQSVYGTGANVFERLNHIAIHNRFTSIFDEFLKAYARVVTEARAALQRSLSEMNDHEPHYALLLAFLRLFEHARAETNTITARHLDFYYRRVLRLEEKPPEPSRVHLLVELARQADSYEIPDGALFKAGKDQSGVEAFFANDDSFVANQAKVSSLKNWYRHKDAINEIVPFAQERLYSAPVANSEDGLGAKLTSVDQSWQPFFNKVYVDGSLSAINMPQAEIGFAIASHYLLMAEGQRTVTLLLLVDDTSSFSTDHFADLSCEFTIEAGWINATVGEFKKLKSRQLRLTIELDGASPAITPYSTKAHGYAFDTDLPIMLVKLRHRADAEFLYATLENLKITRVDLTVDVKALKTLALSNDFGPIDASKPFQPYGASPLANSALIIGTREAFQKQLTSFTIDIEWQNPPKPYKVTVDTRVEYLQGGEWQLTNQISNVDSERLALSGNTVKPFLDQPDLSDQATYDTASRQGYIRLRLNGDFGQSQYEHDLIEYIGKSIKSESPKPKPNPPVAPSVSRLSLAYIATQTLMLTGSKQNDFEDRAGRFFHLAPFGHAEQHAYLKAKAPEQEIYLLPQFKHLNITDPSQPEKHPIVHIAESYIGIADLKPPQNLALFFQVVDGTANPLANKPKPHFFWSYLRDNEWIEFADIAVQDTTAQWLNSGIITLSVPDDATSNNTLLPAGQYWLRLAVAGQSDAVCRLQMVAAQGLSATFQNHGNDPAFPATPLAAGSIRKLDAPNPAVKGLSQPFSSFDGKAAEQADAFYTRVSERLRHKDRAIALWDYEHLILEAFPQIFQAKCLKHTRYEPDDENGSGIYKELAPGHVTIVTIPNQQFHNLRDPLRPYTSLGLLTDIDAFLRQRLSCFVQLHVRNPLFEEVTASFQVRFYDGFDEQFHISKLDEAITRFLSPWAFAGGGNPVFGGRIYKAVLINFVEEQPYVDYVTDFELKHSYQTLDATGKLKVVESGNLTEVEGSKAISLLVSARKHDIRVIHPDAQQASGPNCACESA